MTQPTETEFALLAADLKRVIKILEGNGKPGLVEMMNVHTKRIEKVEEKLGCQEEEAEDKKKSRDEFQQKIYLLLIGTIVAQVANFLTAVFAK